MHLKKAMKLGALLLLLVGLFGTATIFADSLQGSAPKTVASSSEKPKSKKRVKDPNTGLDPSSGKSSKSSKEQSDYKKAQETAKKDKEKKLEDKVKSGKASDEEKGQYFWQEMREHPERFKERTKKIEEEQKNDPYYQNYQVTYNNAINHLEDFTSKVWFGDDMFGLHTETLYFINSLVQADFWFAKVIFQVCGTIYKYTASDNKVSMDNYVSTFISNSSALFNALLTGSLLTWIGGLMVAYAWARYMAGGSFFGSLFKSILVYLVALTFFSQVNGKYVAQSVYDSVVTLSTETTASLNQAKTGYSTSGSDSVLNNYFLQAVWKPYVYMNVEVTKMNDDGSFETKDKQATTEQMENLEDYQTGNDDFSFDDGTTIDKFVGDKDDVKIPMMKGNWGKKFMYASGGVVDSLVMGSALVVLGLTSFVLKIFFLLLLVMAPIFLVLSLVPTFENVMVNFFKNLFGAIGLSLFVSFFANLFLYFYSMLRNFVAVIVGDNYFIGACLAGLVILILWKKREQILAMMAANRSSSFMSGLGGRIRGLGYRNPIKSLGKYTVGAGVGYLASKAMSKARGTWQLGSGAVKHTVGLGRRTANKGLVKMKENAKSRMSDLMAHYSGKRAEKRGEGYQAGAYRSKARQRRMVEAFDRFRSNMGAVRHGIQGFGLRYASEGMSDKHGAKTYYHEKSNEHFKEALNRRKERTDFAQRYDRQRFDKKLRQKQMKDRRKADAVNESRRTKREKRRNVVIDVDERGKMKIKRRK